MQGNRDDTPPQGFPVIQPPPATRQSPQPPQHESRSTRWWRRLGPLYGVVGVLTTLLVASIVGIFVAANSQSDKADREIADAREQIQQDKAVAREQIDEERTEYENEQADLEQEIDDLKDDAQQARQDARREEKKLGRLQDQVSGVQQEIDDNTVPGDGTFIVGEDIEPGTYKSKGQDGCYWERLSGLGGGIDDIIANDNASGLVSVEVLPSDRALQLSGCADFVRQGG